MISVGSMMLAASFLTPALFYGGAAAAAVPSLIHLLARRRFKRIRWAAMNFLMDAERRNRRRIRMEEWILLALRCLAMVLLGLLLARPFLKPASAASLLGGSKRTERVFVLDDSFSMAYQTPDGTPFARAKTAVRRMIDSFRRETPDDTVTILKMSAPTAPVESGTFLDDTQTESLLARLDALTPSQRAIDPSEVIRGVVEVLERSPDVTSAAVYVISDFQRHDWAETSKRQNAETSKRQNGETEAGQSTGILGPLVAWAAADRGLHLVLINVGQEDATNLAVTEATFPGGQIIAGATGAVRATVANFGRTNVENLELQVSVGDIHQPSKTLRVLSPYQIASVELEAEFLRTGMEAVRVELRPDALPLDNQRFAAAEVAHAVRVLVVDGEPAADAYDDEVTFLSTALRPEGDLFSGNELSIVSEAELEEANLSNVRVVILANVYRLSEPTVESLERFVRQGGGVLFFLGDQVDADLYNTAMFRDGEGMLPGKLTEIVRAPQAAHLVVTDRLHPAIRGLGVEGDPLGIGQIPFFAYFGCVPADIQDGEDGSDEATKARSHGGGEQSSSFAAPHDPSDPSAIGHRPSAIITRVIARFDDADGHPAIIERSFGRGRVILFTSTADKEWNQWPDHPTFLPVMMEVVRSLTRTRGNESETLVGEPIRLPIDPAFFEPDAVLRTPAYPNEREVGVTATAADDGRGLSLVWEHAETAGVYQFVLKRREGGETLKLAAVNVDSRESDLTAAQEDELRAALTGVPFDYVKGLDVLTGASGEARIELWRAALIAMALTLMFEQSLAWKWGRRR